MSQLAGHIPSACEVVSLPISPIPNARELKNMNQEIDMCLEACTGAQLLVFNLASSFVFHVAEVRLRPCGVGTVHCLVERVTSHTGWCLRC